MLGGVLLVVFALLSLSAAEGEAARRNVKHTLYGALAVAAVVLVLFRAGLPWAAVGVVLLGGAAKRLAARDPSSARSARPAESTAAGAKRARMTRAEAYEVLGLEPGASSETILATYRRLMKKVHPDLGGTNYLASRLNEAKDVLLGDA